MFHFLRWDLFLAAVDAVGVPVPAPPSAAKTAIVAVICLCAGVAIGGPLLAAGRHRFRKWYADHSFFQTCATIAEKAVPFVLGVLTGVFELFKSATFQSADSFTLAMYGFVGFLAALTIGLPWLISTSKDVEKARIKTLTTQLGQTSSQRDSITQILAFMRAAVTAKKVRIAELTKGAAAKPPTIELAFKPRVQIFTLIKALHNHFARHVTPGERLRVGIYQRSPESKNRLVALYSWDGQKENCFSNSHPEMMRLDGPGGAQSLVVKCYRSDKALHLVSDCDEAAKKGEFVFFTPEQREKIKSMVAFRYLLKHGEETDALILTMDSSRNGFFSPDREYECEIMLDEIGVRLEMELLALELFQKFPPS